MSTIWCKESYNKLTLKKTKKGVVTGNPTDLDLKPGNVSFLNPFLTPLRWQMWKEKTPEWFSTQCLRMIYDTHHVNTNVLFISQLDFFTLFSCRSLKIQLTDSISHPSRLTGSAVIGKRVPKRLVWFLSKEKVANGNIQTGVAEVITRKDLFPWGEDECTGIASAEVYA